VQGYLAASSASAYSLIGMVQEFGPILNKGGGVVSISYVASTQVSPQGQTLDPQPRTHDLTSSFPNHESGVDFECALHPKPKKPKP